MDIFKVTETNGQEFYGIRDGEKVVIPATKYIYIRSRDTFVFQCSLHTHNDNFLVTKTV